jgi:tetratricopeptide (TPR) repeat protein
MEILSTGEKIKRARIYKGYTLKDICGDKVSVSKMSCIENDKVKPEEWVLEFIADKLKIEHEYIKQDVKEQIRINIETIEKNKDEVEYLKKLEYNLGFSEVYKYYDLSFKIMHLIFNYYINTNQLEKLQSISSKYYDFYQKSSIDDNQITYYMDNARFLYNTKEFLQAASYYNNVIKTSNDKKVFLTLAKATYNEAACYIMVENYEKAYEIAVTLEALVEHYDGDIKKADAYQMLAMLSLRMDKEKFEEYENKAYELYQSDFKHKAYAIYNFAVGMFRTGLSERAIEYIKKSLECYPKDNKEELVEFMLTIVEELIESKEFNISQSICDEALNDAINLDNIIFIERAYYFKALILQAQNNGISPEMYMNLSLDSLVRFGTKQAIYTRYMEMGYMYYNLKSTAESIKYFSLALSLEKKI